MDTVLWPLPSSLPTNSGTIPTSCVSRLKQVSCEYGDVEKSISLICLC